MISSRTSWDPARGLGLYASSKAAVRVFSEALAQEVSPFSVRVLIAEPAAFLTPGIPGPAMPLYTGNPIPDYEELRSEVQASFVAFNATSSGDPAKAMDRVVDVVRGEGVAAGRPWPLYLMLGKRADSAIREKTSKLLETLDEWKDVTLGNLDFD
ncbi:hypothetical protein HGRIS_010545 [Hohenbuehelia grisea]|uniref:Uncharacterized protein n=1 Tax=Hohenbuehelia grisea TaxID=104357 RepID=A0ABR3IX43_9AGAR